MKNEGKTTQSKAVKGNREEKSGRNHACIDERNPPEGMERKSEGEAAAGAGEFESEGSEMGGIWLNILGAN